MSARTSPLLYTHRDTDSTREAARARIDRIAAHVAASWDDIIAAHQCRDWLALGYDSWADLCDAEFRGATLALPREERREVVRGLTEAGLSTRAIGTALGVSEGTVRNDRGAQDYAPEPTPVTGLDGKTYTPRPKPEVITVDGATGEILDDPRPTITDAERDWRRAEAKKAAIKQRNTNVCAAFATISELRHDFILDEVIANWQPLVEHWTPGDIASLGELLITISPKWSNA